MKDRCNELRSFLVIGFSIITIGLYAQGKYIETPIIIPDNPTVKDSVYVFLQSTTTGLTQSFGYETRIIGDSIFIHHCVKGGILTEPRYYADTLNLGLLAQGEYFLRFTVYGSSRSDSCTYENPVDSSVTFQVTLNTSVSNIIGVDGYKLYPNPTNANQILELKMNRHGGEEVQITIHDLAGKKLPFFSSLFTTEDGLYRIPLDLTALPSGYYFIRVKIGGELIVVPSIKN